MSLENLRRARQDACVIKRTIVVSLVAAATAHADPAANLGATKLPEIKRASGGALAQKWTAFSNANGDFSVKLPGTPTESMFEVTTPSGTKTAHRFELVTAPDAAYVISYVDLGDPAKLDVDDVLAAAVTTAAATAPGKLDGDSRKVKVDRFAGRDARVKLANGAIVAMRFVVANRLLYAIEVGDATRAGAAAVIKSFRPRDASTDIVGGLLGNQVGNGGFGVLGTGGAVGWGTIGSGRYGTVGTGGTGSGYGVGGGHGGIAGRRASVPTLTIGQPTTSGGELDKAIIRRYIKRNTAKLSYCYEKQLLAKPKLAGTVTTKFVISGNGTVTSSTATGVDTDVSTCVADAVQGIEFPKPKDGKDVNVTYAFTFTPAGP
jgi:hypothetical protein